MQDAIAFFAIRLVCGIAWLLALMPRAGVASGYFRVQMLLILGLSVLFGLTAAGPPWGSLVLGATAFVGSVLWMLERRRSGAAALWILAVVALVELLQTVIRGLPPETVGTMEAALWFGSALAGAGTLGAAMSGMLLGHRYLTAPGMPLIALVGMNDRLGTAAVLRLGFSTWALVVGWGAASEPPYAAWLALRWLAGIAGPLVVWAMVRRILVHRNTQSATGVLFVGVILTFLGELTGDLLLRAVRIPF